MRWIRAEYSGDATLVAVMKATGLSIAPKNWAISAG
jgi:hypothetical protein